MCYAGKYMNEAIATRLLWFVLLRKHTQSYTHHQGIVDVILLGNQKNFISNESYTVSNEYKKDSGYLGADPQLFDADPDQVFVHDPGFGLDPNSES